MTTLLFTGDALAVNKRVRITRGSSSAFTTADVIKIGMGTRLISMNGWNPAEFIDAWELQSADPFVDIAVTTDDDETYLDFTTLSADVDFELTILVNDAPLAVANEVQTLTILRASGGTFALTYDGQTTSGIAYNANAATIQSALEALSNVAPGDITVAGTNPFTLTFGGTYAGIDVALITVDSSSLTGSTATASVSTVRNYSVGQSEIQTLVFSATTTVAPQNEKQTIKINNNPTSGTFTLTYSGQTTGNIAYNASNATITTALEALSNIGVGDVLVTGGPLPSRTITIEFKGALAATNVAQLTSDASGLSVTGSTFLGMTTTVEGTNDDVATTGSITLPVTSGDYRVRIPLTVYGGGSYQLETVATFAHNASAATIKTAMAGNWRTMNNAGVQLGCGILFHADELTVTGGLVTSGTSNLVVTFSNSAYARFINFFPTWQITPGFAVISTGNSLIGGVLTKPTTLGTIETQRIVVTGTVPSSATFNLDFEGTNTADCSVADLGTYAVIDKLDTTLRSVTSTLSFDKWSIVRVSGGTPVQYYHNLSYPFDLSGITGLIGEELYLINPLTYQGSRAIGDTISGSIPDQFEPLFDAHVEAYNTNFNRVIVPINVSLGTIVPGVSSGTITYQFSRVAVNRTGNQSQVAIEFSSTPVATITHATTVVGGSTTISSISGGTFALSITTPTTTYTIASIPYNATADEVELIINNFFGSTVVAVTGGPLPLSEITLTFEGVLGNLPISTSVIPSFVGSFSGSVTPTIIATALPPEDRSNTYRLTVAPGRSSLVGPQGRVVLEVTTVDLDGNTGSSEISLSLASLSCEAIEEGFAELFGKRVVHVVEEDHFLRHEKVTVTPYSSTAVDHRWWFYEDRYLITFLTPFELPEYITAFRVKTPPTFLQLLPEQVLDDNDNNTNDLLNESYRVWFGFKTANDLGTPKHRIALDFVGTQALNTMEWLYTVEPQYATSDGQVLVGRRGIAETLTNQMMRFNWVSVNESSGDSGDTQPTQVHTTLARTPWIPLSSEPVHIKHVLERLLIHFTATPAGSSAVGTLEDIDDAGTAYTPAFFGTDNVQVTGTLVDSWLAQDVTNPDSDLTRNPLRVRLINNLDRANFNFYQYKLVIELNTSIYGMITPVDDPSQPNPRVFSMTTGKVFQPGNNTIVKYDFDSTSDVVVSYNGVSTTITAAMTRREIQAAINGLSTVGRLYPSDATYNQDADILVNSSPRYYTTGDANDLIARPSNSTPIVPHKLARGVTVNGTLASRTISLEMSGNGFQYSSKMPTIGNTEPSALFTLTTTQEGILAGTEVQTISISSPSTPPTSGTFKLNNGVGDTSTIAYNATASTVAAAVTALGANWVCNGSGGPLPLVPVTLTFTSAVNIDQLTVTNSTLKNATASVALTTTGGYDGSLIYTEPVRSYGPNVFDSPENWNPAQAPSSQDTLVFDEIGTDIFYGLRQSYNFTYYGSNRLLLSPRRKAFHNGQKVYLSTTGTLPTGLSAGYYYIRNVDDACTFQVSSTANGSIVSISSFGTGTHTVQLRELTIKVYDRYPGGVIGLNFSRSTDLREHLCPYLTAGFTLIEVGINTGISGGLSQGKFNTLNHAATIKIYESASSRELNVPAICLLTNHTDTTLIGSNCEVGIAMQNGETSLIDSITLTDSTGVLRNTTVENDLISTNTTLTTYQTSIGNLITSS